MKNIVKSMNNNEYRKHVSLRLQEEANRLIRLLAFYPDGEEIAPNIRKDAIARLEEAIREYKDIWRIWRID